MDWNEIVTILGLACIGVLWINAEPAIRLREWIWRSIWKWREVWESKWHWRLVSCCMCFSFWLGLAVTTNLYSAAIISVVAELVCRKLNGGSLL
jgi:hypothetical protein